MEIFKRDFLFPFSLSFKKGQKSLRFLFEFQTIARNFEALFF